jgi:hypothetical protein
MASSVRQPRSTPRRSSPHPAHLRTDSSSPTAWFGWLLFVSIVLVGAGLINVLQGLVAIVDEGSYLVTASELVVNVNYAAWGWALVVLGAALLVTGIGVAVGLRWARIVGVVTAVINAVVNLGFVASFPMWTVIAIALDVLTIYALVVHGDKGAAFRGGRD